jgi:hypothetical protein
MHILMGFLFSFTWSKLLFENMVGACHDQTRKKLKSMQRINLKPMQHSSCGKKAKELNLMNLLLGG